MSIISKMPATGSLEKYMYRQSQQIYMQTGFVGYLRGDFGSTGKDFFSSWHEFRTSLKTPEFLEDLNSVMNILQEDEGLLNSRDTLNKFCDLHPEWKMKDERDYHGVRIDTEEYAYLLRLTPRENDYNVYCYCYKRDWLNRHLANAENGIRFIDCNYNELFRIADGDNIRVTNSSGETVNRPCRYIDDYHFEIGYTETLYHICQFAEIMRGMNTTYEPCN